MFDSYSLYTHSEYVSRNINVTEKKAPTDESVKLLKEFEKAAQDKIVSSVKVENAQIDCVIHKQLDYISCKVEYAIVYKLNGKQRVVRTSVNAYEMNDSAIVAEALVKSLSEDIAINLLYEIRGFK